MRDWHAGADSDAGGVLARHAVSVLGEEYQRLLQPGTQFRQLARNCDVQLLLERVQRMPSLERLRLFAKGASDRDRRLLAMGLDVLGRGRPDRSGALPGTRSLASLSTLCICELGLLHLLTAWPEEAA